MSCSRVQTFTVAAILSAVALAASAACSTFSSSNDELPSDAGGANDADGSNINTTPTDAGSDGADPDGALPQRTMHVAFAQRYGGSAAGSLAELSVFSAFVEPSGAFAIAGTVSKAPIAFGAGDTVTPQSGSQDAFFARLNADGTHASSVGFGDGNDQFGMGIVTHGSDLYCSIAYQGTFALASGVTVGGTNGYDALVAQFTSSPTNPTYSSHETFANNNSNALAFVKSMAPASGEGVIAFGDWNVDLKVTTNVTQFTRGTATGLFLSRLFPASGGLRDTRTFCDETTTCIADAVATNSVGDIMITGRFANGAIDFGDGKMITSTDPDSDAYVAKFDSTLKPIWAKSFAGKNSQEGRTLAAVPDNSGDFIIGIDASGEITTTSGKTLASNGMTDMYIARINAVGDVVWEMILGGVGEEKLGGIGVDAVGGNVFVSGSFTSKTMSLAGGPILTNTNAAETDGFLLWLDAKTGKHRFSTSFGSDGRDDARTLGVDGQGGVVITGSFAKTVTFGPPATAISANGASDIFAVRFEPDP